LKAVMGIDIGGSHISVALVDPADRKVLYDSYCKRAIDSQKTADHIITDWVDTIHASLSGREDVVLEGIGIAMPGPFDYEKGISVIRGVNKYENLYGLDIRASLQSRLKQKGIPIRFENDAACFGLGECLTGNAAGYERVIAVTLGTGLGSAFIMHNQLLKGGVNVPPDGYLYNIPYKDGVAEDYISGKWLLQTYNAKSKKKATDTKEVALFQDDECAKEVFADFGRNISSFLSDWIKDYRADCLVIGGSIAKSDALFLPAMKAVFASCQINIPITFSRQSEISAITGAASMVI